MAISAAQMQVISGIGCGCSATMGAAMVTILASTEQQPNMVEDRMVGMMVMTAIIDITNPDEIPTFAMNTMNGIKTTESKSMKIIIRLMPKMTTECANRKAFFIFRLLYSMKQPMQDVKSEA